MTVFLGGALVFCGELPRVSCFLDIVVYVGAGVEVPCAADYGIAKQLIRFVCAVLIILLYVLCTATAFVLVVLLYVGGLIVLAIVSAVLLILHFSDQSFLFQLITFSSYQARSGLVSAYYGGIIRFC